MKISDFVDRQLVVAHLKSHTKDEVLAEVVSRIGAGKRIKNKEEILERILEREKQGSTGIGDGVAIPHARIRDLKEAVFLSGFPNEV